MDNVSMIAIGDLERLCGSRQAQASAGRRQTEIALWSSSTKVKILTTDLVREAQAPRMRGKPDKQKRVARKKEPQAPADEPQLALEAVDSKEARPKIEVTISEEPKQIE